MPRKTLVAIVAALSLAHVANAGVRVRIVVGSASEVPVRSVTFVNGKYNVDITAAPSTGSVTLAVESYPTFVGDNAEDLIRYVRVESNGSGKVTIVSVTTAAASTTKLVGVEELSVTSNDPTPDGDVYAEVLVKKRSDGTGGVVGLDSQVGGTVSAHVLSTVFAEGNINASIVALQSHNGVDSNINVVQSNSGIFGDVQTHYGAITTQVYANSNVGSSGAPVTIYGKKGVKIVQGNN